MKVELLELYREHHAYRGIALYIWGEGYPKLWKYAPLREAWDEDSDNFYLMSRPAAELRQRASQYVRRTRRRANACRHDGV